MHGARATVGFLRGAWSEKKQTGANKRAIGASKVRSAKSCIFDEKWEGGICKNVLPVWAWSILLENQAKIDKGGCLEQRGHMKKKKWHMQCTS